LSGSDSSRLAGPAAAGAVRGRGVWGSLCPAAAEGSAGANSRGEGAQTLHKIFFTKMLKSIIR